MKLSLSSLVATMMPVMMANGWSFGMPNRPSGLSLLNDVSFFDTPLTRMIRDHDKMIERAFSEMPPTMSTIQNLDKPRYQIINNDNEFKIALDVPGINEKDIHVHLEKDGKFLTISGSRESKGDGYEFSSKFSQSFYVEPHVDIDKFSAQLQNGVLEISAPKDMKRLPENTRKIPVLVKTVDETTAPALESNTSHQKKVDVVVNEEKKEMQTH